MSGGRQAVSVVIPTRDRLPYLDVALASLRAEAERERAEVLVVDDGRPSEPVRRAAERHGARYVAAEGSGLNAARNTGLDRTSGALVAFLDDDVRVRDGWLEAMLRAAAEHPQVEVFAGRITAKLEGPAGGWARHTCGREQPPITALDLGDQDRPAQFAWGSNMAIRRSAFARAGRFDETLGGAGDEQEWQERAGTTALYVAAAWVEHRRAGEDARLRALCRASYARGRAARRFDVRSGRRPAAARELATLGGCLGHVLRRRCPGGLTMVAHSAGRLREAIGPAHAAAPFAATDAGADFLSGASGTVGGLDALRRRARDELAPPASCCRGARCDSPARRAARRRGGVCWR